MSDGVGQIFNDPTLSSLKLSLQASSARQVALASNIVNVNTPGYKRVDLKTSFQNDLMSAMKQMDETGSGDLTSAPKASPDASVDTADLQNPARYDGNTVNLDQEVTAMMKNSADYQFASHIMALKYTALKQAISGNIT